MDFTWISNSNLHWLEWGTLVVLWLFSCHSFPVPMDQRSNKRCPQRIPFKSRLSCLCSGEATQLLSHHQDWSQQPRAPCLPVGLVAEEVPKGQGAILASNVSDPLLCFLVDAFLLWTLQPLSPSSQSRRDEKQILFGKIMIGPLPPSPIGYWVCAPSGYGSVSTCVGCLSKAFSTLPPKTEPQFHRVLSPSWCHDKAFRRPFCLPTKAAASWWWNTWWDQWVSILGGMQYIKRILYLP